MNVGLLLQVKDHILEEPRRLNMDILFLNLREEDIWFYDLPAPPCNTVGCIAGFAAALSGTRDLTSYQGGMAALGLTREEAERLFTEPRHWNNMCFRYHWPEDYARAYLAATNPTGRAQATAARIDHFIATEGRE